jgi:hypothetical protein
VIVTTGSSCCVCGEISVDGLAVLSFAERMSGVEKEKMMQMIVQEMIFLIGIWSSYYSKIVQNASEMNLLAGRSVRINRQVESAKPVLGAVGADVVDVGCKDVAAIGI